MTRFIGIGSSKGGVGKTTLSINLALALHNFGRSVILIDGSLSCPHVALHLGAAKVPKSIHQVLNQKINIRDAAFRHSSGLQLIPGSIMVEHQELCDFSKFKESILDLVGTGEIVIVDMPTGGNELNEVIKSLDNIIIVSTPDMLSATEGLKLMRKAKEFGVHVLGVVLNRFDGDDELGIKNTEALFELPVIGVIPEDKSIKQALRMKQAVVFSHPYAKCSEAFKELASNIVGELYKGSKNKKTEREVDKYNEIQDEDEKKYNTQHKTIKDRNIDKEGNVEVY